MRTKYLSVSLLSAALLAAGPAVALAQAQGGGLRRPAPPQEPKPIRAPSRTPAPPPLRELQKRRPQPRPPPNPTLIPLIPQLPRGMPVPTNGAAGTPGSATTTTAAATPGNENNNNHGGGGGLWGLVGLIGLAGLYGARPRYRETSVVTPPPVTSSSQVTRP